VTIRTGGGLRFTTSGVPGRSQYNCTTVISFRYPIEGGPVEISQQSTGTIAWEQPIGNSFVRPCP
jgi:hypothetical protein